MAFSRSPLAALTRILTGLADQPRRWAPLVAFDPASRHYVRIAAGPDADVWLLTWLPGQGTDWHDHGGSAGAFLPVRGSLTERYALPAPGGAPRVVPQARVLGPGTLRRFGPRHLHRVTNDGQEPAVSLHAYAPVLTRMNTYAVDGDRLRLVAAELAGQSW